MMKRWLEILQRIFTRPPGEPVPLEEAVRRETPPMHKRPRGIRNNNPGNMRGTVDGRPLTPWNGQVGLDDKGFCIFSTIEAGMRAFALQLLIYQRKHSRYTIRQIVTAWAPKNENDTARYIATVCQRVGIGPDDKLYLAGDRFIFVELMRAITFVENGQQPYPPSLFTQGIVNAEAS